MSAFPFSGHTEAKFEAVRGVFEQNFADGEELGAGFAVIKDGQIVVNLIGGWADRKKETAWSDTTLVPVYSTTKGIAAIVLAHLVERLPGFPDEIDPELWLDPPACAAALADLAPMWSPGSAHGYHPLSWGYLVGEIARRISGETLGTTLKSLFPNVDFMIGTPASEHDRCADIQRPRDLADLGEITPPRRAAFVSKWSAPNRGGAIWREIEIPSANGHGTALSVAQIYETYTQGGAGIMGETIFDALTTARTHGPDLVLPMITSFGAGIMHNTHGLFGPEPTTLGHSGWGGSMAIADQRHGLTCAYVMNKQSNILVGDPRAVRLVEAVYDCF